MSGGDYNTPDTGQAVRGGLSGMSKLLVGGMVAGAIGIGAWPYREDIGRFLLTETSRSQEYQETETGRAHGRIDAGGQSETASGEIDLSGFEAALAAERAAMDAENRALEERLARLQAQLNAGQTGQGDGLADELRQLRADLERQRTDNEQLRKDQEAALKRLQDQATREADAERKAAEAERKRQEADRNARDAAQAQTIKTLQQQLQSVQDQLAQGSAAAADAREKAEQAARAEARRQAEIEKRRAEAVELMKRQIASDAVVFDQSNRGSAASGGAASTEGAGSPTGTGGSEVLTSDARGRAFVAAGADAVQVTQAEVIANPSRTIVQGTIIEATLETGVDSSLPGQVIAVVSRPVRSFDGARVLIPAGSKLFGAYSSDVSLGDRRVLIGWSRVITPQGQSVELSAFGGDSQGRSGVTGRVNSRFGQRFGGAALVSLIGAAPALAAAQIEDDTTSEAAVGVTEGFSTAASTVIGEYATLPPIIRIEPGAQMTVIVDRDLEFF